MYDILPTNGSATVLNTNALKGSLSTQATSTASPSAVSPIIASFSDGGGNKRSISLSSISTPDISAEETQVTGVIMPEFMPLCIPSISSFCVNASPEKNFSKSASSVSATASDTASISPSIR